MFSSIYVFQYVIFISQNMISKWQFKICVQAALNCMHGVLLIISGWELSVGCHLALCFWKIQVLNNLKQQICVRVRTHIWHLKYLPNETGQAIIVFPMCKMIRGSLLFWVNTECLFLGSMREIATHGAKICLLCHMYFQGLWDGEQSNISFSWRHRSRMQSRFLSTTCIW